MKKIINYLIYFINAKWSIKSPLKKKFLIFGNNNQIILENILEENYFFLNIQGKHIYIKLFLKTVFKFSFKSFLHKYYLNCIKEIDPEIIISSNDTDTFFWKLKKYFPNKKIILIQNAKKTGNPRDLFYHLEKHKFEKQKLDYVFLMNDSIKNKFEKYIEAEFIIHGSLINNSFEKLNVKKKNYAFISQICDYGHETFDKISNKEISETFYNESKRLLKYFTIFKPNEKIFVIPYNNEKKLIEFEKIKFEEISKDLNLEIIVLDKLDRYSNYKQLDYFHLTMGLSSTILYENFGRGNKSAFFNYLKNCGILGYELGWPKKEKETSISTNINDQKNFMRIMNFLDDISDLNWNKEARKLKEDIMDFDQNNQKLRKLIFNLK